jgi:hypothetical protein
MLNTNTKFDDLLQKYKDMDLQYVNNRLEEYDELVQYYMPNIKWKIPMLNRMNGGN